MSDKVYRAAPLTLREQSKIKALYRKGDAFRDANALGEKYNVAPADIVAVVTDTYTKGKRNAKN